MTCLFLSFFNAFPSDCRLCFRRVNHHDLANSIKDIQPYLQINLQFICPKYLKFKVFFDIGYFLIEIREPELSSHKKFTAHLYYGQIGNVRLFL